MNKKNINKEPKGENMKKTLLSVLAGLAVISSASASSIKDTCLKNPDNFVWVEDKGDPEKGSCVPVFPCKNEKFSSYCDKSFAGGRTNKQVNLSRGSVGALVNKRLEKFYHLTGTEHKQGTSLWNAGGQDYYAVKTSDGGYLSFEFDDTSESITSTALAGTLHSVCSAFGARDLADNDNETRCKGIQSEQECEEMHELATSLNDQFGNKVFGSYLLKRTYNGDKQICVLELAD